MLHPVWLVTRFSGRLRRRRHGIRDARCESPLVLELQRSLARVGQHAL